MYSQLIYPALNPDKVRLNNLDLPVIDNIAKPAQKTNIWGMLVFEKF